jgi:hypothetical protein
MRAFQFRRTQRKYKTAYTVTNWSSYERGLRERLSLTLWIGPGATESWRHTGRRHRRPGGVRVYSDAAIEAFWTLAMLHRLPLRQTEGFLDSLFSLARVQLPVPDHTTVSRRFRRLRRRPLPQIASGEPIHLLVDTSGLTIHVGRSQAPPKRRGWRKIHIGIDREPGTIVASDLGASGARDAARGPALLGQVDTPVASFCADTAYDREAVYEAVANHSRESEVLIPPRRGAAVQFGRRRVLRRRDEYVWRIREVGRRKWCLESGMTKRSTVENVIYRYKTILGAEMRARTLAGQRIEAGLGCHILNRMTELGMPQTERLA